jgi:hypothetical protein
MRVRREFCLETGVLLSGELHLRAKQVRQARVWDLV